MELESFSLQAILRPFPMRQQKRRQTLRPTMGAAIPEGRAHRMIGPKKGNYHSAKLYPIWPPPRSESGNFVNEVNWHRRVAGFERYQLPPCRGNYRESSMSFNISRGIEDDPAKTAFIHQLMTSQYQQTTKYAKPNTCAGCVLQEAGSGFTIAKPAAVGAPLIVTDAVSGHDIRVGSPLQPESENGSVLERALRLAGLSPDQFAYGALVSCKPPQPLAGQAYEFIAPDFCSTRHLEPYIKKFRPRCIVALGQIAARALTGLSGEDLTINMIRGYALPGIGIAAGIPVIPTTHPGYILGGGSHEMSLLVLDLQKASALIGPPEDTHADEYQLHAFGTREQERAQGLNASNNLEFLLWLLEADVTRVLSFDFEFIPANGNTKKTKGSFTTDAHITQVNFTVIQPQTGEMLLTMVADWSNDTKPLIVRILETDNVKVSYNGYHVEEPVARYNGFSIKGREHHDAMWMVHFCFPDLPARRDRDEDDFLSGEDGALLPLQIAASLFGFPAPWKHLRGKDPHFYGARDSHATAVVFLGAIRRMVERGMYGTYDFFVRQYRTKLAQAEQIGYPMSRAGLGEFADTIKGLILDANRRIQELVPNDLKPFKERRPVNDQQLERLKSDFGDALFERMVFRQGSCTCAKQEKGEAAQACPDCQGTGQAEGRRIKCRKCSKHALLKPHADTDRWSCEWCGWTDTRTADELAELFAARVGGRPKNLKSFYKTLHDDDIRAGRYVCPECDGSGMEISTRDCACTKRTVYSRDCETCHGKGESKGMVMGWCVRLPFNPGSVEQIKRYAQARNHTVPKAGLGREGISQLARQTGDPLYKTIHGIKLLETVNEITAPLCSVAAIRSDTSDVERVHTKFMFTDASGFITSKGPDIITAIPAHKYPELAQAWELCTVARPTALTGLWTVDMGPLELECFALEARDEALLTVARNAEEWLLEIAKFKKSNQGTGAIAAVYKAFVRGQTASGVHQANRHLFQGPDAIAYLLSKLEYHFPRALEYRRQITAQAHKQGFLRSRFGYERQFYAVMRRGRDGGGYEQGSDYGNAAAFMARNHAACTLAITASLALSSEVRLISPWEGPFGPRGFIVESHAEPAITEIVSGVLFRPDNTPWFPTVTVRRIEGRKDASNTEGMVEGDQAGVERTAAA